MKSTFHFIINFLIFSFIFYFLYLFFNFNVFELNLVYLFISIYLFSNLPDIDNRNSFITKTFYFFYLLLLFYGINNLKTKTFYAIFQITISLFFILFHFFISDNSKFHRKFPHTFTFGIISSTIFGYLTSIEYGIIAFCSFTLHLAFDNYIDKAIKKDIMMLKKFFFKK